MAFLQVNNISRTEGDKLAVNHVSFTMERHQKIAISGETGSGKTSLLKMIAGLAQPSAGEILFEGKRITGPNEQLIPGHPQIAYLSQYFELRNNYWVYELMEMANKLPEAYAQQLYAVCQVEHLLKRRTNQLSGGEKQRIALARLLTTRPQLLLLDEPFSNSDALHKTVIKKVIHDIGEQLAISCILVSHDPLDVLSWADSILIIKDGDIIQQGSPKQVYYEPTDDYCAGLFGDYNKLTADSLLINPVIRNSLTKPYLYVRPEKIAITAAGKNGLQGTIESVLFCGSYYTVEVKAADQFYRVRTLRDTFSPGDTITLSLSI